MKIKNLRGSVPPVEKADGDELPAHADEVILSSLGQLCDAYLSIYLIEGDGDASSFGRI
jgi:hypothetical protein